MAFSQEMTLSLIQQKLRNRRKYLIMNSLSPSFIDSLHFTNSHLANLRKLGEFRGKQELFKFTRSSEKICYQQTNKNDLVEKVMISTKKRFLLT